MHWAKQPRYRTIFGIAAFLPAVLIVAIAVWATKDPVVDRLLSLDLEMFKRGPRATVIRFCAVFGLTLVLQMGLGAIVALHTDKRDDLTLGTKVMWIIGCVFVGSIFLPLFYFMMLRRYR
jgi:hypothetical protein